MSWEQTDPSFAVKAGRFDELRSEGDAARQIRQLVLERRSLRIAAVRTSLLLPLTFTRRALAGVMAFLARSLTHLADHVNPPKAIPARVSRQD